METQDDYFFLSILMLIYWKWLKLKFLL